METILSLGIIYIHLFNDNVRAGGPDLGGLLAVPSPAQDAIPYIKIVIKLIILPLQTIFSLNNPKVPNYKTIPEHSYYSAFYSLT